MIYRDLYLVVQNYKWVCMDSTLTRTVTPDILQDVPVTFNTYLHWDNATPFTNEDLVEKSWYMTMYVTDATGNVACVLASDDYKVLDNVLQLQFSVMNTQELAKAFSNDGDPQDTLSCSIQVDYDNGDESSSELGQCLGFGRFKGKLVRKYECTDGALNPVSGGGQGTTDYDKLIHKPSINDVPLEGNKTGEELGLLDAPVNEGADGQIIVKQSTGNIWRDFLQKIPIPDLTFAPENSTIYTYTPEAGDVIHFTGDTPADFVLAVTVPDPAVSFSIADVEWEATGIPDFTHPGDTVLVRVLFDGTVYKAATYKDYSEYVQKEDVVDGLNLTVHTESGVLANFIKAQTPYDTQGITIGNPVGGVGGVPVYFTENVYVDNSQLYVQNSCMYYNGKQLDEYFVQADWDESDSEALSYIQNKPEIPDPIPQVQADWDESDSSDVAYIQNKPDLDEYLPKVFRFTSQNDTPLSWALSSAVRMFWLSPKGGVALGQNSNVSQTQGATAVGYRCTAGEGCSAIGVECKNIMFSGYATSIGYGCDTTTPYTSAWGRWNIIPTSSEQSVFGCGAADNARDNVWVVLNDKTFVVRQTAVFDKFISTPGMEILTQDSLTIAPKDGKCYKHTLASGDTLVFDLTGLTATQKVGFEVDLIQPSTPVAFTLPSGILWDDGEGNFASGNSAPTMDQGNTQYTLCFRWDGADVLGNLAIAKTVGA